MNVLHVCGNPRPISESASKQLAAAFFTKLAELNPDVNVTNVDLYQNQPPYVSNDCLRYYWSPLTNENYKPTGPEEKASTYGKTQAALFKESDIVVLTLPLWCNSMPAIVKAWLDQVMLPGLVYTWGPEGATPLHHIRRVILLVSSGAVFKEDDPDDGLTRVIRSIFEFVGITDIAVAWADGQDKIRHIDSEERKQMAKEAAEELAEEIATLV